MLIERLKKKVDKKTCVSVRSAVVVPYLPCMVQMVVGMHRTRVECNRAPHPGVDLRSVQMLECVLLFGWGGEVIRALFFF